MTSRLCRPVIAWRRWGALIASSVFALCAAWGAPDGDVPARWSLGRWTAWRDAQIREILRPEFEVNGASIVSREAVISRSSSADAFLNKALVDSKSLAEPAVSSALGNFEAFVRTQSRMAYVDGAGRNSFALGDEVSDRTYLQSAAVKLQFPTLLRSQQFLRAMSKPETYKDGLAMIASQNLELEPNRRWTWVAYRSQFLKSTDGLGYGRLLILVPNDPSSDDRLVDRWIQFSIAEPTSPLPCREFRSVSMVAIEHGGIAGAGTNAVLADFMRDRDPVSGGYRIIPTIFEEKNPSKNCYDCHKSAILPIRPKVRYGLGAEGRLVEEQLSGRSELDDLNDKLAGYGHCSLPFASTGTYGPSIGPANRIRSDAFIRSATRTDRLSPESIERVRDAMKCGSCHDSFAPINYPQAVNTNIGYLIFEQKIGLVQKYVESGWMPPNNTLSPEEREALWKCLDREYYDPNDGSGLLVEWLRGESRAVPEPSVAKRSY